MNEQLLHDALLERLRTCSDSVMLALDQNGYEDRSLLKRLEPVSYTHLDVYKRQQLRLLL